MKYRTNPKNNQSISLLGFGAMRLPMKKGEIDVDESIKMLRYAIDHGVTYLDTAYVYIGEKSENVVGMAMKDGYREKVTVATKLPLWKIEKPEDMQEMFETQLDRLGVEYIDYYLAHDIGNESFETVKKYDVAAFMKKLKDEGKIKNMGFSFHGSSPEFFKEVIDYADWDFCQIQLNYMDAEFQAGVAGLKYAGSKGLPVVIMEPLRGGQLTDVIPGPIQSYWDSVPIKRTPPDWAFRWVANFPEVTTILSGMSTMEQVVENVEILSQLEANSLSAEELEIISKVADEYNKRIPYACTKCKYCLPCPVEIDIPHVISMRNEVSMFDSLEKQKYGYEMFLDPKPSVCLDCKVCEEKCPQHLHVSEIMAETVKMFEG